MQDGAWTDIQAEQFFTLLENGCVTIERIASHGSSSPVDFRYDQADPEWVLVFRARATFEFANGELVQLKEGDYLAIPADTRHRLLRPRRPRSGWPSISKTFELNASGRLALRRWIKVPVYSSLQIVCQKATVALLDS
jgi:cupin 2 domain-containing protein